LIFTTSGTRDENINIIAGTGGVLGVGAIVGGVILVSGD
jgi:hypothetical protein